LKYNDNNVYPRFKRHTTHKDRVFGERHERYDFGEVSWVFSPLDIIERSDFY